MFLEPLESRQLMATIAVTSLADNTTADGQVTLREAIQAANTDTAVDGSTAGSGADTIVFNAGLFAGGDATINLSLFDTGLDNGEVGPTALTVSSNISIQGPTGSNGLTINRSSASNFRLFAVTGTGNLSLDSVTLSNSAAVGFNGGFGRSGGGGGAGLGGAIFVDASGALSIANSTLTGNLAQGGLGNNYYGQTLGGGGGGGMGGHGGNTRIRSGGRGWRSQRRGEPRWCRWLWRWRRRRCIFLLLRRWCGRCWRFWWRWWRRRRWRLRQPCGNGGAGGFGGGGGGSHGGTPGSGGFGGGGGNSHYGGDGAGMGGAVFSNGGTVTITNSTLTGNTAAGGVNGGNRLHGSGFGGAVFSRNGSLTVLNSTLSSNTVTSTGASTGGRGIYVLGDGATATLTLNNALIGQSDTTVTDVVASSINSGATSASGVGNLIRSSTGLTGVTIASTADPLLAALADNGGPTFTMALGAGSPAINAGNNAAAGSLTTDQRGSGFTRVLNAVVDIGAFEYTPPLPPTLSATLSGGVLTITDTDGTGKNNSLTVQQGGWNYVITDAAKKFVAAPAGGTLSNGNRTLTIPVSSVTAGLTIDAAAGTDSVTFSASSSDPLFRLVGPALTVLADSITVSNAIISSGGAITLDARSGTNGSVTVWRPIVTTNGNISVLASGAVTVSGTTLDAGTAR